MKVLLIGRWGKTHAIAKALVKNPDVELYTVMDKNNTGISQLAKEYTLCNLRDINKIEQYANSKKVDLIVVVPALALETGMTTYFEKRGFPTVGPSRFCSQLEGDKAFLRNLMKMNGINAFPEFKIFYDKSKAINYIRHYPRPVAIKPAGITEGDGVKVMGIQLKDKEDAMNYVREVFNQAIGELPCVIVEDKISGEEFTIQFFCDGTTIQSSPVVRDYKLLKEGDSGTNTPGMGSVTCSDHSLPFLKKEDFDTSVKIIADILNTLKERYGEKFKGILSGQYMVTEKGIKLIEINIRPGDSEILNILPIMETDFLEVCNAIAHEKLNEIDITFQNKATVCKYVVPEGFPTPDGNVELFIDRNALDGDSDIHLFQSCFQIEKNLYQPSPRLFAITGVADTLEDAYAKCETGLSGITGKGIHHRADIGNPILFEKYTRGRITAGA